MLFNDTYATTKSVMNREILKSTIFACLLSASSWAAASEYDELKSRASHAFMENGPHEAARLIMSAGPSAALRILAEPEFIDAIVKNTSVSEVLEYFLLMCCTETLDVVRKLADTYYLSQNFSAKQLDLTLIKNSLERVSLQWLKILSGRQVYAEAMFSKDRLEKWGSRYNLFVDEEFRFLRQLGAAVMPNLSDPIRYQKLKPEELNAPEARQLDEAMELLAVKLMDERSWSLLCSFMSEIQGAPSNPLVT